jgi:hypothetical protein
MKENMFTLICQDRTLLGGNFVRVQMHACSQLMHTQLPTCRNLGARMPCPAEPGFEQRWLLVKSSFVRRAEHDLHAQKLDVL